MVFAKGNLSKGFLIAGSADQCSGPKVAQARSVQDAIATGHLPGAINSVKYGLLHSPDRE